jgi:hypothetical protein
MADFWPLAPFLDRLHCGGGAAMTAERARCVLYQVENSLSRGGAFLRSFRDAVDGANIEQTKLGLLLTLFCMAKFIQQHFSFDRFITCGYTCSMVTSRNIAALL